MGITEARGRLMERNGEDYVCPNCTAKKNQVVRPATSALTVNKNEIHQLPKSTSPSVEMSATADQTMTTLPSSSEDKVSDDVGIKGRIEKASNPTGKKKIKIFQPVRPCKCRHQVFLKYCMLGINCLCWLCFF